MGKKGDIAGKMEIELDRSDFSRWYNDVLKYADLCDKRYPIKGMNVWTPYGWKIMRLIDEHIRRELDSTGHGEVNFPLLIPKSEFQKEADHIKGFDSQVYWVTHGGLNELDVPMLLRPTSETAMYPMFSLWVRSHTDLPLKTYQIVNTFRYETKQTRAFIRVREIHFFEAHTCHRDFEDAERQIGEDLEIMDRLGDRLCLPCLKRKRPEWDKFAGADYTIGIDCYMPSGKTLQLGSVHQYRTNFSIPYDIRYEDENGEHRHVHQTTYGMSERLVGAIVGIHGDNRGIIMPPDVAPIQIAMVPIIMKKRKDDIVRKATELSETLRDNGYRVELDLRDLRPGSKFYHWELKGVPLRIEIGPRDVDSGQVMMVRRTDGGKVAVPFDDLVPGVARELKAVKAHLLARAEELMKADTRDVTYADEAYDVEKGLVNIGWCGDTGCDDRIVETLDMNMLGIDTTRDASGARCGQCGGPAKHWVTYAKTY